MSLFDAWLSEESHQVELVTMHADLSSGIAVADSMFFPDTAAALDHAQELSSDKRERSFLRCGAKVQTLEAAKHEVVNTRQQSTQKQTLHRR